MCMSLYLVLFRSPFLFVDSITAFVYDFTSSKKNSDRRRCAVRKKKGTMYE